MELPVATTSQQQRVTSPPPCRPATPVLAGRTGRSGSVGRAWGSAGRARGVDHAGGWQDGMGVCLARLRRAASRPSCCWPCKPVALAKAVVRRDGRVQAAGHPADHARLGVAEQQLDTLSGTPGLIDDVAASVSLAGKVKGKARRAVTPALTIRFTLLMTLMPDADYPEALAAVVGDLVGVPWQRPYQLPTATVLSTWRQAVGPSRCSGYGTGCSRLSTPS